MHNKNETRLCALITGASKGIGRAVALKLAAEGVDLILTSRKLQDLIELQGAISPFGVQSWLLPADLSQTTDIIRLAGLVKEITTDLDILVNNAGVFQGGNILEEPEGQLEDQLQINLISAYHLTRQMMPLLLRSSKGHIFNMCSIASLAAYPNGGSYTISKFAMYGFSKVLREELKSKSVRVTALLPGATWSASWQGVSLPYERLMEAKDIAHLLWACYELGPSADVEELIVRPLLGDL